MITLNEGFDRGNDRTNAVTIAPNGSLLELDASSMIAEVDYRKYKSLKAGINSGTENLAKKEVMVEFEGSHYFLDEHAKQGKNPTTGFRDKNRYHSKHTKVALMAYSTMLIQKMYPAQTGQGNLEFAVNLVMGVPIRAYQEEAAKIVNELVRSYDFGFNGRDVRMHINMVKVFMEGTGAAIMQGFEAGKTIGIVDSGSLTTNLIRFDGSKAHTEDSDSMEIGVGTALDKLNTKFERKYGRDLEDDERQQILRASIDQVEWPSLYSDGQQIREQDLRMWIKEAIDETGAERNTKISGLWSNQGGKVAGNFKKVLHVGGGAYYFHQSLKKIIGFAARIDEPEKANARGFAYLADNLAQRNLKRA